MILFKYSINERIELLVKGESFNSRKKEILSHISTCRSLIRTINKKIKNKPHADNSLPYDVIASQRAIIKEYMDELTELKRWQKKRVEQYEKK